MKVQPDGEACDDKGWDTGTAVSGTFFGYFCFSMFRGFLTQNRRDAIFFSVTTPMVSLYTKALGRFIGVGFHFCHDRGLGERHGTLQVRGLKKRKLCTSSVA